ncbi:MAG: amidohydrolase [Thermoproteota archaeon]|nr:amidohydrolase [Thermoproteota archaeon]
MELLIHGGTILTMGPKGIIRDGAVAIEENCIIDVGKTANLKRKYPRYEKIDAKNKVVLPGFVNTHQHAGMSLLRGYADDLPLKQWLENKIWPLEKHMTSRDVYVGALLTAVESILGGTTTINTMYYYAEKENEAKAFADVGVRGVVGYPYFSFGKEIKPRDFHSFAKNWHNKADGRIRVSVAPHAPYTVSPESLKKLREITGELNQKYGSLTTPIMWHIHVAETEDEAEKIRDAFKISVRGGVVEYLDSLGVLGDDVLAVHCVSLTERDIQILKRKNVKVSHNPVSNLKLGSGVSPVPKLLEAGVTVGLGTDSSCSNNNADMFQVMKVTALLHKSVHNDPTLLPAEQVLRMATIDGAKALLWDQEIGSIETGKKADLVVVDFWKPHLCPVYNEGSHLVYAAGAADVDTVIINGNLVMENRKITTVDVDKVMNKARESKERLLARLHN